MLYIADVDVASSPDLFAALVLAGCRTRLDCLRDSGSGDNDVSCMSLAEGARRFELILDEQTEPCRRSDRLATAFDLLSTFAWLRLAYWRILVGEAVVAGAAVAFPTLDACRDFRGFACGEVSATATLMRPDFRRPFSVYEVGPSASTRFQGGDSGFGLRALRGVVTLSVRWRLDGLSSLGDSCLGVR